MFPGFKAKCGTQGTFISDVSAYQPKVLLACRNERNAFVVSLVSMGFEGTCFMDDFKVCVCVCVCRVVLLQIFVLYII